MKLSSKLQILSFLPLGTAAVIVFLIGFSMAQVKVLEKKSGASLAMFKTAFELNHRVNYYLLYREQRSVKEWFALHDSLNSLLSGLRFDEPEQDELLSHIRDDSLEMKRLFTLLVESPRSSRWRNDKDIVQEVESRLTNQLLIRTRYLSAHSLRLYEMSSSDRAEMNSRADTLALVLILLSALVMVVTLLPVNRSIALALRKLTDGAERLGSGDLSHRIGFRSDDELGKLAKSFDTMAENLQDLTVSRDELTREMEERTQAELALKASEAKFRWLYDSDLIGMAFWNMNGSFTEANSSFCNLLGVTDDELKTGSVTWRDATPPELALRDDAAMEQITAWGYCEAYEKELINRRTGRRVPVIIAGALLAGSRTEGVAFAIDLTERKRAEEALRFSEATLKLATETTGVGTFDYYPTTAVLVWSEMTRRHFGLLPDFPVDYPTFLAGLHPDDRVRVQTMIGTAIKGENQGRLDTEFRTIGIHDGRERWISARGQVIINERNEPVRLIGTMLDVTERKRNEEFLKQAMGKLEQSNRELEQFAYVASHDLQEPLRMVASFVQLLAKKYQGQLDEKAHEYIEYAVEGALRMQKLIDGLLAYSRINRGAPFHRLNANEIFAEAVARLAAVIAETGAQVTRADLPVVWGDEMQFLQLLQNLIGNAVKYRQQGHAPVIHVAAERNGQEWVFSVRDNGIGIDPEYYERIFHIFQRLHNRSTYPGTGIGLALCKRIIERHGGRIWVESKPGEGSTFFFTIPVRGDSDFG